MGNRVTRSLRKKLGRLMSEGQQRNPVKEKRRQEAMASIVKELNLTMDHLSKDKWRTFADRMSTQLGVADYMNILKRMRPVKRKGVSPPLSVEQLNGIA